MSNKTLGSIIGLIGAVIIWEKLGFLVFLGIFLLLWGNNISNIDDK